MPRHHRPAVYAGAWLLLLALLGCQSAPPAAASLREEYRQLLFENRRLVPMSPEVLRERTVGENRVEEVKITTEAGQDAVVLVMRPKRERKYPAILLQHFLGGKKDDQMMMVLLGMLAARGYLVAAIDGRFRGEREKDMPLPKAIEEALRSGKGHPWLIDTVFDMLRTIDYLVTRPDVDPERVGMAGISEGGIETWMAAAADERIRVVAPVIGVTRFQNIVDQASGAAGAAYRKSFEDALQAYALQVGEKEVNERVVRKAWEQLLPGFMDRFDAINLVPLIAPRPLLILSHEKDEIIPLEGARQVFEAAQKRYSELGAADKIRLRVAPNLKHAAMDLSEPLELMAWFDRYLKPSTAPTSGAGQ
jgi:cephalosporin-C deacetylase-like acetyl esterase